MYFLAMIVIGFIQKNSMGSMHGAFLTSFFAIFTLFRAVSTLTPHLVWKIETD